ncbi:MAG: DNA mismatch endonuclease Vsr [Acidobacteriaceae bacterium]|nr:DNA mismatch endonuclease Vsr [Acidobacteriaceae bacterium]
MRAIRSKDMKPELAVRSLVHRMGYRYRLHRHDLPGRPDLVFPGRKKVIFVHGCFWHCHNCKTAHVPKSNRDYWEPKLERNRTRDARNLVVLKTAGWQSLVLWECELNDPEDMRARIRRFLGRERVLNG